MADATVQPKVYKSAGGDRLNVKEAGYVNFNDQDFTGAEMRLMLLSRMTKTQYAIVSAVLAVSVMTPGYGVAFFSAASGVSTCSIKLPSAFKGACIELNTLGVMSNLQILAGNGPSLVGQRGSDLSQLQVVNGSANSGYAKLMCFTAGEWTIVMNNNRVGMVEQPSS